MIKANVTVEEIELLNEALIAGPEAMVAFVKACLLHPKVG